MRLIITILLSIFLTLSTSSMFASNEPFYKNIDFSNIDLVGIIKDKGKGEYKVRTVQPLNVDEINGDTIFIQGMVGNFSQFGKYRIGTNLGLGFRNFSDDYGFGNESNPVACTAVDVGDLDVTLTKE